MSVAKNVTITNGSGFSTTTIERDAAGNSYIGGSFSTTNGPGLAITDIFDTNIGGNVTVKDSFTVNDTQGGSMEILNHFNTMRSLIKGSVTESYVDGSNSSFLGDTEVKGNVTIKNGSGPISTGFLDGGVKRICPCSSWAI